MRSRIILFSAIIAPVLGLAVAAARPGGEPIEFEDARMIIEFNATDEDVGMQIFLDGDAWNSLRVRNPQGQTILNITGSGGLNQQGLTELFFESSEPPLDELTLAEFKARFPAGTYRFTGTTIDGEAIRGTARFTHRIPAAPVIVLPAEGAVVHPENTVIDWNPVANPPGGQIVAYQVIVTQDLEVLPKREFSAFVPATITRMKIPSEFMARGANYEFEVLAIEAGGNQTIASSEFRTSSVFHLNDNK